MKKSGQALKEADPINLEESFYLESFFMLHTERNADMLPIPFTKIVWFEERFKICDPYFYILIRKMDHQFLKDQSDKVNKKQKASAPKPNKLRRK